MPTIFDLFTSLRLVTAVCGIAALSLLFGAVPTLAVEDNPMPAIEVADEETPLTDRFMLRMGGYHARNANTILRLDSNNAPVGAFIDFNNTLGGESEATVFKVDGLYRFNTKHGLGVSWYNLKFTGTRTVDRDIEWEDQIYPVNTRLDSEIAFNIYKLNYQYSLFHNEKVELGASIGLHIMQIRVSMSGITSGGLAQSDTEAVTAPLPVWGLFAGYNFTPKLKAFYFYELFNISYDDKVKGGLQDFRIGLEYRIFRNIGLGVSYNRFDANLEMKQDTSTLTVDTKWNGGMLYGAVYF